MAKVIYSYFVVFKAHVPLCATVLCVVISAKIYYNKQPSDYSNLKNIVTLKKKIIFE